VGGTIALAEGTGSGIGMIGYQISYQRKKLTVEEVGSAPAVNRKPRIRGNYRANAANRQNLRKREISEGDARRGFFRSGKHFGV